MIWIIYIILAIFALFLVLLLVLLFAPVSLKAEFENELRFEVKFLFFKFKFPKKAKKIKRRKKSKKSKNENFFISLIKKRGVSGSLKFFCDTISLSAGLFKGTLKKITIKKLELEINIASEDPCKTAVIYGQVCAVFYPLVAFILDFNKPEAYGFDLNPDFISQKTSFKFNFESKAKIWDMVYIILNFVKKYKEMV